MWLWCANQLIHCKLYIHHAIMYTLQACKESRVQQPGASGFCYWASDFLFLTCPTGKCCFFGKFKLQKDCNLSCYSKRILGLVVDLWASTYQLQLARMQAAQLTFFAPCLLTTVEPQYNETLYDKVLSITNDFLYLGNHHTKMNLDIANKFCQSLSPLLY